MNNLDNLIHPDTETTIEASTDLTWLWVLLLGPFHHLFLGRFSTALIWLGINFVIGLFLFPMSFLVSLPLYFYYVFQCRTIARKYYMDKGYIPLAVHKKRKEEDERHQQLIEMMVAK